MLITLAFEDTPAEIRHVHRIITQLLADQGELAVRPSVNADSTPAEQWWAALSQRIGPDTRRMAGAAAQMGGFGAWQDLADKLDVSDKTAQSWHRNLGRSIKRVNTELGTSYQLFGWNVALNKFAMAEEVRAAILK
jgi:hypothetical protein